ncbi:CBS domain-containing protein [Alkalibacillus haloalkaliphilus]|uniref:CBS domain-containing protein n=1 Tax=Alkalibacillus haloalkaliphilus TaxID=94136 RepID=UPI0002F66524|nr:CBS domain-containing protein [Alkalibacillus haloalkaliphilus]
MENAIKNLMSSNIVSVTSDQTVQEAAALMEQNDIGAIPVIENGQLRGIITDRDITLRATAKNQQGNCPIGQCMSSEIVSADASMDVHEAAQLMAEKQIRRLPVTENGQTVGMLSIGDLAQQNIYRNEAGDALSNISIPQALRQSAQQSNAQAAQQQNAQMAQQQNTQMAQQQNTQMNQQNNQGMQ